MKTHLLIGLVLLVLCSCTKILVEVTKQFIEPPWENRAQGISCSNTASSHTFVKDELTFSPYHTLCVNIEMDASQFEIMRYETRFGPSIKDDNGALAMGAFFQYVLSCDVPFPKKYNWYQADVSIDGITLDNVGIRKKGFLGSVFSDAPSIKIQTDKFVNGQSFRETESITLGNNSQDPSRIIQSLRYKFIENVGYPGPRCNLANVTINGDALGVYSHIESIKEDFLQRAFGRNEGALFEGQVVDFIHKNIPRWDAKKEDMETYLDPIIKIADVLESSKDEKLLEDLSKLVNIEKFITFWALEFVLEHGDGYTTNRNNFFVYFDPNDQNRATFIPWGMNDTEFTRAETSFVSAELPRRLSRLPGILPKLEKEIGRIMDLHWNEEEMIELVRLLSIQVESAQLDPEYDAHIEFIMEWISNRRNRVEMVLNEGLDIGSEESTSGCLVN